MKHIHIPETNITIPRIAASFAPAGSDYTDTHNYYLVDAYLELGGTFLDTANVYGRWFEQRLPVNELWLGRYFSERHNRHHFILDSKGGALNPWDKSTPRINSECLRHDLENSLSNLHTDYLDYYWVHVDDPAVPVGEILEIMNQFKKEGKIRYFGCSNWSAERIHEAMRYADDKKITGFTAHQTMKNGIDPVGNYLITISQGNDLPLLKSLPKKPAGILPKLFWHTFINYHILLCRLLVYSHCVILLIV